jgi:hypothetical protein
VAQKLVSGLKESLSGDPIALRVFAAVGMFAKQKKNSDLGLNAVENIIQRQWQELPSEEDMDEESSE